MQYKRYEPTCVELLFGRAPTRFVAECAIPKHKNAKIRYPFTSAPAQARQAVFDSCKCRYCPNEFTNGSNTQRLGNVLRIDDLSFAENARMPNSAWNKSARRHYQQPRNQWKKPREPKSRREKFQEWYINKRVEEMKNNISDQGSFNACCCTYCCCEVRENTPNNVVRCGCCVCGEACNESPEETLYADENNDIEENHKPQRNQPYLLHRNTRNEPIRNNAQNHADKPVYSKGFRKQREQLQFHRPSGNRTFENGDIQQIKSDKIKLSGKSSRSYDRGKSHNYMKYLKQENLEKEQPARDQMNENCYSCVDRKNSDVDSCTTDASNENEEELYLEKLKEDSISRLKHTKGKQDSSDIYFPEAINCDCEYSQRKVIPENAKCMYDADEVFRLKEKLDAALDEIKMWRNEVLYSKKQNKMSNIDPYTTLHILNDCQKRCAYLEQLVQKLDRNLGNYEGNANRQNDIEVPPKTVRPKVTKGTLDIRPREVSPDIQQRKHTGYSKHRAEHEFVEGKRKQDYIRKSNNKKFTNHDEHTRNRETQRYHLLKKPKSAEETSRQPTNDYPKRQVEKMERHGEAKWEETQKRILRRSSSSPKPSAEKREKCESYEINELKDCRKPGGVCYHIRCFPSDHVFNNPKFVGCRDYDDVVENMKRKRFFKPR